MTLRRAAVAVPLALLTACGGADPEPTVAAVPWREVALPAAQAMVRDLARCGDHWYAVGGLPTGPAAWSSVDGTAWTAVRLTPVSYYGERSTLSTVACRGVDAVAVGAASGGAHGNPRTSTWRSQPDGSWLEFEPAFEQFGGQNAVGVGSAAAGRSGWAIVGNWLGPDGSPGPAVWRSADGTSFSRVLLSSPGTSSPGASPPGDSAPPLPGDPTDPSPGALSRATDIAALPAGGWLVVGEVTQATPSGAAWTSVDGKTWSRAPVAGPLALVTPLSDGMLAVGPAGAWWYDGAGWQRRGGFADAAGWRFLTLAGDGSTALVAAAAGDGCRLWATGDAGTTWREIGMPVAVGVTAETVVTAAMSVDTVVLATDDGTTARLWRADTASIKG